MATTNGRIALSFLTAVLVAAPALAARPQEGRTNLMQSRVMSMRPELGLDDNHSFQVRTADQDELGQTHVRLQQTYKGVRVMGGEVIAHSDREGTALAPTLAHKDNIYLNVNASLSNKEALAIAHGNLSPKGAYAFEPTVELVILPEHVMVPKAGHSLRHLDEAETSETPNAEDFESRLVRHTLAYLVHTELENGTEETSHTNYLINAHTGAIIRQWNDLHTADAIGLGKSQFSGNVSIHTNTATSGWQMKDTFRAMNITTYDLAHGTGSGTGTIYSDADNTWGNNTNFTGTGTTTGDLGQTAAVDAHYGIEMTYDFFKNILGRNGIDNANRATYSRVHYSSNYDNAFWSDSCFCMTYGDGSSFKSLESMDVAGHEMSHGVCANSANLTYSGESGGLNESNSDIFGNMVELFSRSGMTLPSSTTNTSSTWSIGEDLSTPSFPTPLRYMYKPSKDGSSPDAWSTATAGLDVHYSSGPNNRMFFFLSQGAAATAGDYYSSYTPAGFTGIGPAKASQIWYRALTVYLTSSSKYTNARAACISAAKDLYGAGGAEEQAVWNAYAAINVGAKWAGAANTVTAAITTPSANVTIASGTTQSFVGTATDSATGVTWTYNWTFGDGGTATAASTSHTYTNTGTANITYTATFKATDNTGAFGTATRTITVQPAPVVPTAPTITSQPTSVTVNAPATATFSVTASGTAPFTYQWRKNGTAISGATNTSYTTPATATTDSGSTYSVVVTNSVGSATSSNATLTVNATPAGTFNEVEANNTIASANAVASTFNAIKGNLTVSTDQDNFSLTLTAGQKVTINMTGPTGVDWDLKLKNAAGTALATSTGSTATETVTYTNTGTSALTVYPNVYAYSGVSATPYNLALTYVTPVPPPPAVTYNEVEANNSLAAANVVSDTATKIVGYIGSTTDTDYFKLNVGAAKTLKVVMSGPTGSTYDYDLYFYNAAGTQLASGTGATTSETVSWTNGATATAVYVAVKRYAGSSTTTPYNLVITR